METLLISPASRTEIVLGKFLTVMLASILTALLNLIAMGITGFRLAGQFAIARTSQDGAPLLQPPSLPSAIWMILLLVPLSGFFSALCVALAVLARSMKEGQYYLTPLYLVAMPLIFITLVPGIELNLFYSLVPITGVALLLRALMLGEYALAARYFLPVLVPTIAYGLVALRWAIDQFNRESVLFREAERFDLRNWLVHLVRDRGPTPTGGEALLCFTLMIVAAWFVSQMVPPTPAGIVLGQVAYVLIPPLLLAVLLTSDPRRTLRLSWPRGRDLVLAAVLVPALNPLQMELRNVVETLFPVPEAIQGALQELLGQIPNLASAVLILALVPAICEEVAFRGFILSGLESGHRTRSAIVMSALLFGFLHVLVSLFHQLFNAGVLGLVLGLLAVRSRSLLPGIVFHFLNNALAVVLGAMAAQPSRLESLGWLYRDPTTLLYHWPWVALGAAASGWLLATLARGPRTEVGDIGRRDESD